MSPRYYLISTIIVVALTLIISFWKHKKTAKDVSIVFCQVVVLWAFLFGAVFGLTELFVYLGIAQSGFIIQGEDLK